MLSAEYDTIGAKLQGMERLSQRLACMERTRWMYNVMAVLQPEQALQHLMQPEDRSHVLKMV